jgi:hypothetical protein
VIWTTVSPTPSSSADASDHITAVPSLPRVVMFCHEFVEESLCHFLSLFAGLSSHECMCATCRYLPIGGSREFVEESIKLGYGEGAEVIREGRVAAVQSLSGTGSCRLFADFQHRCVGVGPLVQRFLALAASSLLQCSFPFPSTCVSPPLSHSKQPVQFRVEHNASLAYCG